MQRWVINFILIISRDRITAREALKHPFITTFFPPHPRHRVRHFYISYLEQQIYFIIVFLLNSLNLL